MLRFLKSHWSWVFESRLRMFRTVLFWYVSLIQHSLPPSPRNTMFTGTHYIVEFRHVKCRECVQVRRCGFRVRLYSLRFVYFVRGVRALVFEFSSLVFEWCSSFRHNRVRYLYLGYAIDRHDVTGVRVCYLYLGYAIDRHDVTGVRVFVTIECVTSI